MAIPSLWKHDAAILALDLGMGVALFVCFLGTKARMATPGTDAVRLSVLRCNLIVIQRTEAWFHCKHVKA